MEYFIDTFGIVTMIILVYKMREIRLTLWWAVREGRRYGQAFRQKLQGNEAFYPSDIDREFNRVVSPLWNWATGKNVAMRLFADIIFREPMILLLMVLTIPFTTISVVKFQAWLLVFYAPLSIINVLAHRATVGFGDIYRQDMRLHPTTEGSLIRPRHVHYMDVLWTAIWYLLTYIGIALFAFAGAYCGFDRAYPNSFIWAGSDSRPTHRLIRCLTFIYYSLFSLAASMPGDLQPGSSLVRLVTSLELVVGLFLIVCFVLSIALSFQKE